MSADARLSDSVADSQACDEAFMLAFEGALDEALARWRACGRRGVWFRVPVRLGALLPVLEAKGFSAHHARSGSVMMTSWLPEGESCLPPFATHQVGVAGLVFDDRGRLLVIKETHP